MVRYTTVKGLWEWLGFNQNILYISSEGQRINPGTTPARETVQASPVDAGDYYLDYSAVNEDTVKLYSGSTQLTIDTHYTFDSDLSKVSITSAGATALSGNALTAEYEYCTEGHELTYNKSLAVLNRAEAELENDTEQRWSDTTTIQYRQVVDESPLNKEQFLRLRKTFCLRYNPIYHITTTVDGAYTSGGATISVVDASKFPSSGTIYIGGNKVTYSAKTGNDLTVPTSTPSISDGATVSNIVVEYDMAYDGAVPSYNVLTYGEDYEVYDSLGIIKLLSSAYATPTTLSQEYLSVYKERPLVKFTYMQAWHEPSQEPSVPEDVVEAVYEIAARQLNVRQIRKSLIGGRDQNVSTTVSASDNFITRVKEKYAVQLMEVR